MTNIGAITKVLARRHRAEVDERRAQLERRAQRAVVGLVDRAGAVGIGEQRATLVIGVAVGILERRRQRERGRTALKLGPVDALLERAETHPLALEDEAGPKLGERYEVVVDEAEPSGMCDGCLANREVRVDCRHGANCRARAPRRQDDWDSDRSG